MGYSILELVLRRLREEGFAASVAYPGQVFPQISETVAAVHIEKVDRANLSVTIEITMVCPASMGGSRCEMDALRATEVLRWSGAVCIQNGCSYDGVAQVYTVSILATYTGVTDEDSCVIWPGFYCYVANRYQRYAVDFQTEQTTDVQVVHGIGEPGAVGIQPGRELWQLRLEELIPAGSAEEAEPEGEFQVMVVSDLTTETYYGCRWTSVLRQRSREGLRRIRKGYALRREVE
ncbi:MAG: hypothetical protein J6J12_03680 [Oscillospiraceae bacterium]|nr:hypothetical protein [Oscillospiraceae bacterium]